MLICIQPPFIIHTNHQQKPMSNQGSQPVMIIGSAQELHEADVILHVRDMSHPAREAGAPGGPGMVWFPGSPVKGWPFWLSPCYLTNQKLP